MDKITKAQIEEAASRLRGTGHWEGDLTRAQRNRVRQYDVADATSGRSFRILWVPHRKNPRGNTVEVWDLTLRDRGYGRDGQFVSAYSVNDFLDGGESGLILDNGVPVWRICGETMIAARAWVAAVDRQFGNS